MTARVVRGRDRNSAARALDRIRSRDGHATRRRGFCRGAGERRGAGHTGTFARQLTSCPAQTPGIAHQSTEVDLARLRGV